MTSQGPSHVIVPWGHKKDLPRKLVERAYETCKRGDKAHCINSNLVRAFAEHQGRKVRFVHTFKGDLRWSEEINDQWCRFIASLSEKYARCIDAFDHDHKHFRAPVKCPMGPVRFVGFSEARSDHPAVVKDRKSRMNARIKDGKLVPGSRFRERQLPYVQMEVQKACA